MKSRLLALPFVPLFLLAGCVAAAPPQGESLDAHFAAIETPNVLPAELRAPFAAIRPTEVYNTCKWLCLPEFAGRYPGTPEYRAACDWAAGLFAAWGLEPGGAGDSYLQPYPSPYTLIDDASLEIFLPDENAPGGVTAAALEKAKDFLPHLYSDSGDRTGEVVFAGWGIAAPELGYDDYAGLDVNERFVLCFRGTPDPARQEFKVHDEHRTRMLAAKARGALGLLYIAPEVNANPNGDLIPGFLPGAVSDAAADRLLAPAGRKVADLRAELARSKTPQSFATGCRARLAVTARHFPEAEACNVAGWLRGSDPELQDECVVIGGHFDHCGRHMGLLFAGADDNASGSACVIHAARAFSLLATPPRRSVLFVLFGSEERGLIGSRFFADHPPAASGRIAAIINLDMEGAGDACGAAYSAGQEEVKAAIEEANAICGTVRSTHEIKSVGVRSSDFAPFFEKGVPCAAFWSNGPHLAYHQPGDTIYRINPDILADVTRVTFLTAWFMANAPATPAGP